MRAWKRWTLWPMIWALLGALAVWWAWSMWPRAAPRADAALPARRYTPEQLGPSPRQVIEAVGRKGYPSPDDVAE